MKILVLNWRSSQEGRGESEFLFEDIAKLVDGELITLSRAAGALETSVKPFEFNKNSFNSWQLLMAEYIRHYCDFEEVKLIITDDVCGALLDAKVPIISIAETPYLWSAKKLLDENKQTKDEHREWGIMPSKFQLLTYQKSQKIISTSPLMTRYVKSMGFESEMIQACPDTNFFQEHSEFNRQRKRSLLKLPIAPKIGMVIERFHEDHSWTLLSDIIKNNPDIFWLVLMQDAIKYKPKLKNVAIINDWNRDIQLDCLGASDFFLSTKPISGNNRFVLEAMSCNLPIIAPETGYFEGIEWLPTAKRSEDYDPVDFGFLVKDNKLETFNRCIKEITRPPGGYEFKPRRHLEINDILWTSWWAKFNHAVGNKVFNLD